MAVCSIENPGTIQTHDSSAKEREKNAENSNISSMIILRNHTTWSKSNWIEEARSMISRIRNLISKLKLVISNPKMIKPHLKNAKQTQSTTVNPIKNQIKFQPKKQTKWSINLGNERR